MRGRRVLAATCALLLIGAVPDDRTDAGAELGPADVLATDGRFLAPFAEPTVGGVETEATCIERTDGSLDCKPAAGSLAVLPGQGSLLYFNALEGTENVRGSIVAEFGNVAINAQARRLELGDGTPTWFPTDAVDSGANRDGNGGETLLPNGVGNTAGEDAYNDGSLFCADLSLLADGRVMAVGGTSYYQEPGVPGLPLGVVELEGLRNTRVYDPETNAWSELPGMQYGRWYPSLVTLGTGGSFVASGVTKLLKPVYRDRPTDSGRNVVQTEIQDPETGRWEHTGPRGDRSLPLYPRLHLLPNGHVYYNAAGQVFNPFGQAYDEALWNIAAVFDPVTRGWQDLGVPGLNELTALQDGDTASQRVQDLFPADAAATIAEMLDRGAGATEALVAGLETQDLGAGVQGYLGVAAAQGLEGLGSLLGAGFRGSTFSVMLPLRPGDDGRYRDAEFLTAGGAVAPSPGSYLPVPFSRVDRVSTGDGMDLSTRFVGSMNTARWYSTGTLLPTGEVLAVSGATADEVVGPGSGFPVTTAELWDPVTETWRQVAEQQRPRTYHNTAALLPDGRVLVGGHDTISTLYGSNITLPAGQSPAGRDPSFEIFEPPYLHYGVDQPTIRRAPDTVVPGSGTFRVTLDVPASDVDSVVLVRNTSITHLVDGDQRTVELPVVARHGRTVTVQAPPDGNVAPPGPYLLFANRSSDQGPVPSVAADVTVPFDGTYAVGDLRTDDVVGQRPDADPGLADTLPFLGDDAQVDDGASEDGAPGSTGAVPATRETVGVLGQRRHVPGRP